MSGHLSNFPRGAGGEPSLLGEDSHFFFLFKPPGLPVFPPHDAEGPSLLAWWLPRSPQGVVWPAGFEGGLCHRLDTSTSGLVLATRDVVGLEMVRQWFSQRYLHKTYLFLSAGSVPWNQHHVSAEIAHHNHNRRKMIVRRGHSTPHRGKWYDASTQFQRVEDLGGGIYLWQATITTGVMHQIRVHAAWVGLPLLGDGLYGGEESRGPAEGANFWLHHLSSNSEDWSSPQAPLPSVWFNFSSENRDRGSSA